MLYAPIVACAANAVDLVLVEAVKSNFILPPSSLASQLNVSDVITHPARITESVNPDSPTPLNAKLSVRLAAAES